MYHKDTKQLKETFQLELLGDAVIWMTERAQILWSNGKTEDASALRKEFSQGPAPGQGRKK